MAKKPDFPWISAKLDPDSRERLRRATAGAEERLRAAMKEAIDQQTDEVLRRIWGDKPFPEFDFGTRQTGRERPFYSKGKAESPWSDPNVEEAFRQTQASWLNREHWHTPSKSIFGNARYLAVSEDPGVAVAAAQLREARAHPIRQVSRDGSLSFDNVAQAEEKLKRRIVRAHFQKEAQP